MNQQSEHAYGSGEIFEPEPKEEFESTGRYDNEPSLAKAMREAFQIRMACQAQSHKLGELIMNLSTNIMKCTNCKQEFDLNELVSPELRVRRVA